MLNTYNMKKLNLNLGQIGEMLSNEQMKRIIGGNDGYGCTSECSTDLDCVTEYGAEYQKCTLSMCDDLRTKYYVCT